MRRNVIFGIVVLIFVLAALELQSLVFGLVSIRRHAFNFYRPDIFSHVTDTQLAQRPHWVRSVGRRTTTRVRRRPEAARRAGPPLATR